MSTTWILVANSSAARLYANHGPRKGLSLIREYNHPESRGKGLDLVSDRPGHNQGAGNGHGSFVPPTSPKEYEAERFALELARELEQGRSTNSYDRLVLIASSPFIGTLNGRLTGHVRNMVSDSIDRDYTRATPQELTGHLEHCMYL